MLFKYIKTIVFTQVFELKREMSLAQLLQNSRPIFLKAYCDNKIAT